MIDISDKNRFLVHRKYQFALRTTLKIIQNYFQLKIIQNSIETSSRKRFETVKFDWLKNKVLHIEGKTSNSFRS